MCLWLCPVAVHVCVVHVGQVLFALLWTEVIGHADGGDRGYKRRRKGGRDGGGGGNGAVV